MALVVKHAVYGALPGGNEFFLPVEFPDQAFDVTRQLKGFIDAEGGVVACDNNHFGDPSPGNRKHFGAVVERDGVDLFFACEEGQTIDFNHGGGATTRSALEVKFAVYGALPGNDPSEAQAFDVTAVVQAMVDQSGGGRVPCNNASFGDPSVGNTKHFAAIVNRGGADLAFACREGQIINFGSGGGV
jgi:hypothetical protein